jgi:hypothetical protein
VGREHRRKGLAQTQHAEEVGLELVACDCFAVGREKAADVADAGVVDDEGDIARPRDGCSHLLGLGDIEADGLDTGQGDGRWVACAGVDLARTAGQQFACEGQADAAVGASDEDGGVVDFHGMFLAVG